MIIYVVEQMYDYTSQIGWSTSKEIAETMAKKWTKKLNRRCWVKEYKTNKNNWCEFDCD